MDNKMKEFIKYILGLFLMLSSSASIAQETSIVHINLLPQLSEHSFYESFFKYHTGVSLTFEKPFAEDEAWLLGLDIVSPYTLVFESRTSNFDEIRIDPTFGLGVHAGFKKYLFHIEETQRSYYFSPLLALKYTQAHTNDNSDIETSLFTFNVSSIVGVQNYGERWIYNLYLGAGIGAGFFNIADEIEYNGFGFRPFLGFTFGRKLGSI